MLPIIPTSSGAHESPFTKLARGLGHLSISDSPRLRVDLPALTRVQGAGYIRNLSSFSIPALSTTGKSEGFSFNGPFQLVSLTMPNLVEIDKLWVTDWDTLTSISFPKLADFLYLIDIQNNSALESIEMPLLTSANIIIMKG